MPVTKLAILALVIFAGCGDDAAVIKDAHANGAVDGERIETPSDFDDVWTFCSHGQRVFVTETDAESSSSIAIASGYDGNGC